ncbi:PhzF family phenazine biosynthesis protein [Roseiconus nitratireducens]|uniref:PhzF family phenazine biosynthesis protein n=1 Tax=Roseiconus nitratireducens TaxID=2605748 RepID=A0A5M6CWH2_9BACT|nr:PhzF family phenazine biosynthesis protein [Roseiconus nitratireducens]KAA5539443.1 PhzF family phenazine biosynthesis protein [Roseiconus nitratireducens]
MNHPIRLWQIDAFADQPFTGNPAAVCVLEKFPSDGWMQSVAAEMNLSETAFVVPANQPDHYELRWFTPRVEVDLCGHATLAAAHVIWQAQFSENNAAVNFATRSGNLRCLREGEVISLDFPATPPKEHCTEAPADAFRFDPAALLSALGLRSATILTTAYDLMVVIEDEQTLRSLAPDQHQLSAIETRGVMVTARSENAGIDFVSRFFAPRCGIDEDPVTGSAHCCLAPYWSERLGKTSLVGYQASSRGGSVLCEVGDGRVKLSGKAVTVLEAQLRIEPR